MITKPVELPMSAESEQAVLGSLLIDPDAILDVQARLRPTHFSVDAYGTIYAAILDLTDRQASLDLLTLQTLLEERGQLDDVGGMGVLVGLVSSVPSALHVDDYVDKVLDRAARRRALIYAEDLARFAYDYELSIADTSARVANALLENGGPGAGPVSLGDAAQEFYDRFAFYLSNPLLTGQVRGTSTGFHKLNELCLGLQTALYVVGAVTGLGKTAFCLAVAANVAGANGRVLYFTLEQTVEQLTDRLICSKAGVPRAVFLSGSMIEGQQDRILEWTDRVSHWPMDVYGPDTNTMRAIRTEVLRAGHPDLIVVDWSELVQGASSEKKHEQLGEVARWALLLAQVDGHCPVLLAHQIATKQLSGRRSKRPVLGDLYQTSEIESNADVVWLLHRDDYWEVDPALHDHKLEVAQWKDRTGAAGRGVATLGFGKYSQIYEWGRDPIEFA